ncbi:unnamed protein product [Bemisia tabaci]|uniref:Zinc finger protein-like 1 homolog n=1 Tax=Bemisia tabaci TaxID=7038 RepID=A0A9P0APJ9_BEMTA|nr:PREDICTED: zinc finger protein-like 1 homolog [Bemisia tabaci]XP_018905297.1 PREDICTED: zinc finger protein-like 1 homolog [Bemisia tabaci]CAH0395277.1 unnamed protein product [Bemisia tabaci]
MGLCKCPKRKVTNQFCYEHRVNICEHCMVANHSKCIVQSYIQWLQDSDYDPVCQLCYKKLVLGDCIRLTCYHVFHWKCLDEYARQLPSTTAPAGYSCPTCHSKIFPPSNLVSPVADELREKLAGVNWARIGLGLPILSIDREKKPPNDVDSSLPNGMENSSNHVDVVVHIQDSSPSYSLSDNSNQVPRRGLLQSSEQSSKEPLIFPDHDENKYKRRSFTDWFKRWWMSVNRQSRSKPSSHLYKRYCMVGVLFFIALICLIVVFKKLGSMATENDPIFDPHHNSFVKVEME